MANEAKVVGNVVLMEGAAFARNQAGERRQLVQGDAVFEGDVIVAAAGGRVELAFDQGGSFLLAQAETVTLDSTVFDSKMPNGNSSALLPRPGGLTSTINQGSNLDELLQEILSRANSNSSVSGVGAMQNDGNGFVQIMRTVETLASQTYGYTSLDQQSAASTYAGQFVNKAGAGLAGGDASTGVSFPSSISASLPAAVSALTSTQSPVSVPFAQSRVRVPEGDAGVVIDGYLAGSTVVRSNGSGNSVTTNVNGVFTGLTGSGAIKVSGGVDQSTGQAFTGVLFAPAGSAVITPLTTLVNSLINSGMSVADAKAEILAKLGLHSGFDLLNADPIALSVAGDSTAFAVLKTGAAIATLLQTLGGGETIGFGNAAGALAKLLASPNSLDLSNPASLISGLTAQMDVDKVTYKNLSQAELTALENGLQAIDAATSPTEIAVASARTLQSTLGLLGSVPVVSITEDANNDGIISRSEISGTVGVNVSIPVGAVVGDTLRVSGQTPVVLTLAQIKIGSLNFEYTRPADDAALTVTATLTNVAGNVSPEGTDSAVMGDTTATAAPVVVITEDANNDGSISRSEISATVGVSILIPAGAVAGDTLTVSGSPAPGNTVVLTAAQITAGSLAFEYARPADGATLSVTASWTDVAGNVSPEGHGSAVMADTTATAAPVVIITEDTNRDGSISGTEISGTVGVSILIPAGAVAGDTLTVSGSPAPGNTVVLTAAQITAGSLAFEYARPADGATLSVTASWTDVAGNVSLAGSDSAFIGNTTATVVSSANVILSETDTALSTSGTLTISDVDNPATFVAQTATLGTAGTFSIDTAGAWRFTANSAFDNLNVGSSVSNTFTVAATDGTLSSVQVSLNGSNDAALLSSAVVALAETDTALSTSGTLTISDVDNPATFVAQTATLGTAGTFSIDTAGAWRFTANSAFDNLNVGSSVSNTFTVAATDGTLSSVQVSLNGSNDAAVISGTSSASITESDVAQSASGTLTSTDVDGTANLFTAQTGVAGSNGYGSFSIDTVGVWTYTMTNAQNQFVRGTTYTDSITVTAADGTAQVITVSMLGTSDVSITGAAIASSFSGLSLYAGSNFTAGDSAVVTGGVMSGTYTSLGAGAKVDGGIFSGGYTTTGATSAVTLAKSTVSGSVLSGSYVTTGADSIIRGAVAAVGAITEGAGSTAGSTKEVLPTALMVNSQLADLQRVVDARAALTAMGSGTALAATMDGTANLLVAGVYSAASLTTAAGTILALDGQGLANQTWVFNITDIVAFGASTKIVLTNAGAGASVIWNSGGYVTLGASAEILGTIFALNYIVAGADAIITGPNGSNGGLFAQNGYITLGAGAKIGVAGNTATTSADLVTGTADAGSLVTLRSASSILGTVTADSTGNFSYTLTAVNVTTLGQEANKTITASITDTAGATVTSTAFTYNDKLGGSYGNDSLLGTAGIDTLKGGVGNDILQGGRSNDLLIGGDGADTFKWILDDQGTTGIPTVDVIKDFNLAPVTSGGDMLDLRDLLVGESSGSLANFLHFEKLGTDTIVHISTTGGFAADPHNVGAPSTVVTGAENQKIVLAGVDMIGVHTTDQQVIQDLLTKGKLHTD